MTSTTRVWMAALMALMASAAQSPRDPHVAGSASSNWTVRGGGTWVEGNGILRQADNKVVDPKKLVVPALATTVDQEIVAQLRVDSFPSTLSRAGVTLRTDAATGAGYNFLLLPGNRVGFLADGITWGAACGYQWSYGNWYWMKFTVSGGTLTGRIWADGQTEAQGTTCTQTGWGYFPLGAPGLNGGSFGETVSFNNVSIGAFFDGFNANAPTPRPLPPSGVLTSAQLLTQVQTKAVALGFDLGRFIDIMHTTAHNLVCTNNPSVCKNYTPGTFAVVPSSFYGVGTWMRDSTWALAALNNVDQLAALTSKFASAGDASTGRVATLILNDSGPWFGAGGQGNPVPDDDSNLMFAIAAKLGGQSVATQPYLNKVYGWIHEHADANGKYRATSFGWEDSFYPLGVSGPASVTVASNMQGLYAVALRALKDLGVSVPQAEIDAANAQYASLTVDGRMRAYENSDIVDVASLMGDALSLFIWNQPLLSDAVVQNTIASFAEVYDASGNFVGYKVLSNPDGSFLPPGMFPVENAGAGTKGGYYLNGGSWMHYEALALYAGIRHNIPSMRDVYVDRLVRRMVAELRAGTGSTPGNSSNEFLCTAPGAPGDPCGPIGSAEPERANFGWNTFVVRLLSNDSPTEGGIAPPFGAVDTPAAGASGLTGSIAVTGWALDDSEVASVRILRDPVDGELPGALVFIGNAVFVAGARPDVAALYPSYPLNTRAGWGYLLLTNMLPNAGNGTYRLHAYADDASGHSTLLGSRTINCANATATRPFGAIDTPGQGETISGSSYVNFGWVLTPQPKSIPTDGSTITVYVDGVAMGHPVYNLFRSDVAGLFPGLANTNGAVGAFTLDTTTLSNGLHTIAWGVTDSANASEGIGSRYFMVQNGQAAAAGRDAGSSPSLLPGPRRQEQPARRSTRGAVRRP
jgi:hypothetical protein